MAFEISLIYMSGFLKMALKNCIPAVCGRFFLVSKGDDIKIKRKVNPTLRNFKKYLSNKYVVSNSKLDHLTIHKTF